MPLPSRKIFERLGATFVDIVDLAPDTDMYRAGDRQMCRYRIDLDSDIEEMKSILEDFAPTDGDGLEDL